jgi:hypothetical protein
MSEPFVLHIRKLTWRERFLGVEGLRPPVWRFLARARWNDECKRKFMEEWARIPQQIEEMKRLFRGNVTIGHLEQSTAAQTPTIWIVKGTDFVMPVEGEYIAIEPRLVQEELCKIVSVVETRDQRVGLGVTRGIRPSRACAHLALSEVWLLAQNPEVTG